ncbi:MAG: peptidyl-prolyl cis-trans isomerase [Blastocatellia bacterium]|jgi:peptidyl-prolyl cis-trans isomerase D|nr:peptidyl-prolyl cis-trans isomerase [Blastocatellia bacterium]
MERSRNLIIVGFAVLMAVSLVLFYAPGRNTEALSGGGTEVIARVGGDDILVNEFNSRKQSVIQRYGGQFGFAQLGYTNKRLLDEMIQSRITAQEASRLNLGASDGELKASIKRTFRDAAGNFIGFDKYKERVVSNYGDLERFEGGVRDDIASQKLLAFVTAGVHVSDEEVQKDYQRQNVKFDLVYVAVTPDKVAEKIQPTDEELRAYFDQHKTNYRIYEPQKKIRYLFIDQTKMGEKLTLSDADLKAEYDKLKPENKEAGNRVQQIVLKVANPGLDATVKAKADQLATQARGQTGTMEEKEFGDLAKGQSEDPATAKNGGMLPNYVKKDATKASDPLQHIFETEVGGISGPFKSGNAYYIYRRGESVPKTFEQAKPQLLASLRNRQAYDAASALAARISERAKQEKDFQKLATEFAGQANMNAAQMLKETGFIVPGDDVPDIGSNQQFEDALEPLNNAQDVGAATPIKGGFAIPMLVEKKDPRLPEFDETKEKVAKDLKLERAKAQLEEMARNLANGTGSAAELKAAAQKLGLEAKDEGAYKLGMPLGEAGTSPGADEVIYGLKEGELTKTPIKIGDAWFVVGATKRTEADLTEFNKNRDRQVQQATDTLRDQVFSDYIAGVKARMESEGRIYIDENVMKQLESDEPEMTNPALPRRPPIRQG